MYQGVKNIWGPQLQGLSMDNLKTSELAGASTESFKKLLRQHREMATEEGKKRWIAVCVHMHVCTCASVNP
eukprot:1152872-Pelagomonas_calceolata.AAC.9